MAHNGSSDEPEVKVIKKPIPDGGYGWVVLVASFFISFFLDGIMYTFNMLLPYIKEYYNITDSETNLITGLNTGFLFCSGPIVASLTNTFGCRAVIMVGGLITAILYFLCVLAPSIQLIWLFYGVLGGIATGCTYISSLIIIAEYFDKKIGIATGIVMAGSGLGSFVMPDQVQRILIAYDWKMTMSVLSALVLLSVGLGYFLKPLNPTQSSEPEKKPMRLRNMNEMTEEEGAENPEKVLQTFMGSVYSLHKEKQPFYKKNRFCQMTYEILKEMTNFSLLRQNAAFTLITLSNFFTFSGFFIPYLYLLPVAKEITQMENAKNLLKTIGILNIPFRLIFGWVADRRFISPLNLNTLCVIIATVPFFFYKEALSNYEWGQYTFAVAFAIGSAGMNSLTTAYLLDIVPIDKFASATGIINLFRGFGCVLGQYFGGMIVDMVSDVDMERKLNHIPNVFYFAGMCFVIGSTFSILAGFWVSVRACCNKGNEERGEERAEVMLKLDENNNTNH